MPAAVPPLYAPWIDEILGAPIPREKAAACRRCSMVGSAPKNGASGRVFFDATTLCCTFEPELPNFLVGRILADRRPAAAGGRRTVAARLRRRAAVTPLGLGRTPIHALIYENARDAFGTGRALHCPHHVDGGPCGIWEHRCSTCATWFCKYDRGAVGQRFWSVLNDLLKAVERDLALWCALESKIDPLLLSRLALAPGSPPARRALDHYQVDGTADPAHYAEIWGVRAGREVAYFQECGRRVGGMRWPDVAAVCGSQVHALVAAARDALARLRSRTLPDRLVTGDTLTVHADPRSSLLVSYSAYDPLSLPRDLVDALPWFDGRPLDDALRAIRAAKRIRIDRALVLRLVDFGILVPARGGR